MDVRAVSDSLARLRASILDPDEGVSRDLEHAETAWPPIEAALADAERQELAREDVRLWLRKLRDLACDVQDLADLVEYQIAASLAQEEPPSVSTHQKARKETGKQKNRRKRLKSFIKRGFRKSGKKKDKELDEPLTGASPSEISDASRRIRERLDEVAGLIGDLRLQPEAAAGSGGESSHCSEDSDLLPDSEQSCRDDHSVFVGRDAEVERLVGALRTDDVEGIGVIAVVGAGGIGKTALCRRVYSDPRMGKHFRGWVYVGESFCVLNLVNSILGSFSKESADHRELSVVQEKLMSILQGKRFLLVMDGAWCRSTADWEAIKAPLLAAGFRKGSRILLATHSEEVARAAGASKVIHLGCLSREDGWSLFRKFANIGDTHSGDLVGAGEQIFEKCGGLPLAIKFTGSLLGKTRGDADSWSGILHSDVWGLDVGGADGILRHLYLSYLHLTPDLKACFRFLNFIAKGQEHPVENLIDLWIAHGLLKEGGGRSLEASGFKVIDDLASRSFLERVPFSGIDSESDRGSHIRVHDLVLDVAKQVSCGDFFCKYGIDFDDSSSGDDSRNLQTDAHHLSFHWCRGVSIGTIDDDGIAGLRTLVLKNTLAHHPITFGGSYLKSLHLLDVDDQETSVLLLDSLHLMKHLRVLRIHVVTASLPESLYMLYNLVKLDLTGSSIGTISGLIGNLRKLRFLNLSYCCELKEIPESVSKLSALEELNLRGCPGIQDLPTGITRLANLHSLDLYETNLHCMPSGISNLTKLRYLPQIPLKFGKEHVSGEEHVGLTEFKSLKLKQPLRIHVIGWFDIEGQEAQKFEMDYLDQVFHLGFGYNPTVSDGLSTRQERIMLHLKPPANIEEWKISTYGGVKLPSWMGDPSFSQLKFVELSDFRRCTSLSPLHQLPSLMRLDLRYMESLINLAVEEDCEGSSSNNSESEHKICYPKLEFLLISDCYSIECLPIYKFTAIRELGLQDCHKLRSIQFVDPASGQEHQNRGYSSFTILTREIYKFTVQRELDLRDCDHLQSIQSADPAPSQECDQKRGNSSIINVSCAHCPLLCLPGEIEPPQTTGCRQM